MTIRREEKQGLYCLAWSAQKRFNVIQKKLVNVILILTFKRKSWLMWLRKSWPMLLRKSCSIWLRKSWSMWLSKSWKAPFLWKRPNDRQISQWGCKCWPYLKRELIKCRALHFAWRSPNLSWPRIIFCGITSDQVE